MTFILPIRPSRHQKAPKSLNSPRCTRTLHPPLPSPQRRPSLASRAGVAKRRSSVSTTFNAPSMSFFEAMFGDDFPDTFVHNDGRSCKSKKTIFDLPLEMIAIVCQSLSNRDIKQLRLTHREFAEKAELRIDRVYISPNRANLLCLDQILDHPLYRQKVREIVWDDGRLIDYTSFDRFHDAVSRGTCSAKIALRTQFLLFLYPGKFYRDESDWTTPTVEDCVQEDGRLSDLGKALWRDSDNPIHKAIMASDAARTTNDATEMSEEDSYILWKKLCQDEREIIKRGWDVNALQRALSDLPNLQRITLTDGTQRPWNVLPTYDTPFSRALPANLRRIRFAGWDVPANCTADQLPVTFRGYSIMMSLLAANPLPDLQELVMDPMVTIKGLPPQLFQVTNIDYTNTMRVLSGSRLKKLRLSIAEYDEIRPHTEIDLLEDIISAAQRLENLDLCFKKFDLFDASFLQRRCDSLKHLTLRTVNVTVDWFFEFLTQSKGLETCVLDRAYIAGAEVTLQNGRVRDHGKFELFDRLKAYFAIASSRGPRFTWIQNFPSACLEYPDECRWVIDNELDAFIYNGGEFPFRTVAELGLSDDEDYKPGFGRIEAHEADEG